MKRFHRLFFGLGFFLFLTTGAFGQQRPLLTEDVDTVEPGYIRAQIGFDFFQNQTFGLSGFRGDLTRLTVGLHTGISRNVTVSVEGSLHNFLDIRERRTAFVPLSVAPDATSTKNIGDFTLSTKIKLRNETRRTPSIGFRLGVQLPNSDQARGIGTNSINVFSTLLVGKTFLGGRLRTFGNLGAGLLTGTVQTGSQQDVLLYGLAAILKVNDRINLLGEVHGRHNPRTPQPGLESQSQARLGMRFRAAGFQWDVAAVRGFTPYTPRSGVTFGVTYEFKALEPMK